MKIKCPKCSATNEVQKYCGNCGSLLLKEGAEVEQSQPIVNIAKPQKRSKMKRWLVGFLIFIGFITFGPIALDLILSVFNLDNRYSSGIAAILGLVAMIWYGMDLNGSEPNEEEQTL